jgi:hypothetical protein
MRGSLILLLAALAGTGCTHLQLKRSTLNQISTVTDIEQKQVLDNLAMFVTNSNAMPFFSVPGTGTAGITDTVQGGGMVDFTRETLAGWGLSFGGSRGIAENWTLGPINDPHKLHQMQCIYQIAIGAPNPCADCCKVLGEQFPPRDTGTEKIDICDDHCRVPRGPWFCVGGKHDVLRGAPCVGHCGDTYVWVPPSGMGELTYLTLAILEVAVFDPPPPPAEVVRAYDASDKLTGYTLKTQEDCKLETKVKSRTNLDTGDTYSYEVTIPVPTGQPESTPLPSINPYYNPLPGLIRLPPPR